MLSLPEAWAANGGWDEKQYAWQAGRHGTVVELEEKRSTRSGGSRARVDFACASCARAGSICTCREAASLLGFSLNRW